MRTAAKLMVECLVTEGVKYIFGIPGEENLELVQAIADEPRLHFVVVRHEQGAAFMADVCGRLTGKAGVCLATLGPGATNLVTGVADANLDGAPLVAITGQVSSDQMHLTSHQNLDLAKIFEPITKRTKLVMRPDTVNEIVRLAFKYAEGGAGRMGAAHIDLPVDIAKMQVSGLEMPLMKDVVCQQEAEESQIQMAAASIRTARKPLIFVGNNAVHYASSQVITEFAAKLVYPERRVLVATGDGGFMMNSQELETAVRLGVNFVVVIFHDSEYGLIKWKEEEQYVRAAFVDFTNPDFVALAETMHCKGVRVNSAAELSEAIRKGFEEKVPVIIDTPVDYSANEELSAELRSL